MRCEENRVAARKMQQLIKSKFSPLRRCAAQSKKSFLVSEKTFSKTFGGRGSRDDVPLDPDDVPLVPDDIPLDPDGIPLDPDGIPLVPARPSPRPGRRAPPRPREWKTRRDKKKFSYPLFPTLPHSFFCPFDNPLQHEETNNQSTNQPSNQAPVFKPSDGP